MSEITPKAVADLNNFQIELSALASNISVDLKGIIPRDVKAWPPMRDVKKRLWHIAESAGGISALSHALPSYRVWEWKEMLEKDGPWELQAHEFARVCEHFQDPILYYLIGKEFGTTSTALNSIPRTRYDMPTLSWTLRRYQAEIHQVTFKYHVAILTWGHDRDIVLEELKRLITETFVLLKQIELHEAEYAPVPLSP